MEQRALRLNPYALITVVYFDLEGKNVSLSLYCTAIRGSYEKFSGKKESLNSCKSKVLALRDV